MMMVKSTYKGNTPLAIQLFSRPAMFIYFNDVLLSKRVLIIISAWNYFEKRREKKIYCLTEGNKIIHINLSKRQSETAWLGVLYWLRSWNIWFKDETF